jgi:hypothetical protein
VENVGLVYFLAIWYILRSLGMLCGRLGTFVPIWGYCAKKSLATLMLYFLHR